ncbi:Lariat debranching enzyme [Penicillium waksmanii]|uniref:Lariat debranching enzyme n=1 Tax=Penicillium waksmanii TaxID=69791 RepID=UPI00254963CB|nr:Lariat debranching enzyme [Penicillium waksmanii]KAJ5983035.1 Lariat debranching enzyme [Penicillium waksmanii]
MDAPEVRVATVGCGHGSLNLIYDTVAKFAAERGWDGVDIVIIGGDFQALRNADDAACLSVPTKFRKMGDYHEYYSGQRLAPFLTIFCGGNHEASNHLFELYYGGWIAHNIYYLGAANVIRYGPLRISGMSGIWKGYDYRKTHHERIPYRPEDLHSVFHVRELDVRKLLQIRTQVDIGLSHDWPHRVENFGDFKLLFRKKRDFEEDSKHGKLGNQAAREVMDRLRPQYWFSAHLHVEFAATIPHGNVLTKKVEPSPGVPAVWAVEVASPKVLPEVPKPSPAVEVSSENSRPVASDGSVSNTMMAAYGNQNLVPHSEQADRLAAWGTFQKSDTKIRQQQFLNLAQHKEVERPNTNVEVTWKHLSSGKSADQQDSLVYANKRVKNDDEIDLDSENDSSHEDTTTSSPHKQSELTSVGTDEQADIEATTAGTRNICLQAGTDGANEGAPDNQSTQMSLVDQAVSENMQAIDNKLTKFLALDKPNNHNAFVKLLSISPVSDQSNVNVCKPYRLQYDKEWLAITRVFADDLVLGDKNARIPDDLGEDEYLPRIQEQESWVEENVVQKGLMNVPYNFTRSAPNPPRLTAEFCELLQIDNKFYLNEEQRFINYSSVPATQMANGDEDRHRGTGRRGGHRGRGRRGHRGGHRGSGRGTQ